MSSSPTSSSAFAISTTFTPPATCTEQHLTMMERLAYEIWMNYPDPVDGTTITDCYPSPWMSSYLEQETATTPLPAISPIVCPVGYGQVLSTNGYIACCPSSFLLASPTKNAISTRPGYGGTCYTDISTVVVTGYDNSSVTATSTWAASESGAQAYALVWEGYALPNATGNAIFSSSVRNLSSALSPLLTLHP
jgi:hypothetical protein